MVGHVETGFGEIGSRLTYSQLLSGCPRGRLAAVRSKRSTLPRFVVSLSCYQSLCSNLYPKWPSVKSVECSSPTRTAMERTWPRVFNRTSSQAHLTKIRPRRSRPFIMIFTSTLLTAVKIQVVGSGRFLRANHARLGMTVKGGSGARQGLAGVHFLLRMPTGCLSLLAPRGRSVKRTISHTAYSAVLIFGYVLRVPGLRGNERIQE